MSSPLVSVIVPACRETVHLVRLLQSLENEKDVEVIVAIPAGDEESAKSAAPFGVKIVKGEKGRGAQMNLGASEAKANNLLFCHADTLLPEDWKETVINILERESVAGGGFKFSIDSPLLKYRLIAAGTNVRAAIFGLVYGDQALFTRRDTYRLAGGFRPLPVMEDVDFVRRLRRIGKIVIVNKYIKTSPRRWEKDGAFYRTLRNVIMIFLYLLGVPPERLARFY